MKTKSKSFKITYSTLNTNQIKKVHQKFDGALVDVKNECGDHYSNWVNGEKIQGANTLKLRSPINQKLILGHFTQATRQQVSQAVQAAKDAFVNWNQMEWKARCDLLQTAADLIRDRKYYLAAVMTLEVGKNRLEALGDVEESADLISYYCQIMEENNGFVRKMGRLAPNENVVGYLVPFGVWGVIAPFNFPMALSAGMAAGALVTGNTVIYKPSSDAPWTGALLNKVLVDAGLPNGVFNLLNGSGSIVGEELVTNNNVDGLVFTGSKTVGMDIYQRFSKHYPKPCIIEMGGKNPAIVTQNGNLDIAAEGIMRSAFGFGGQKCSACSRAYIEQSVFHKFLDLLIHKTKSLIIGNPIEQDTFLGPLINEKAYNDFQSYVESAHKDGTVLTGGKLYSHSNLDNGFFVEPTIITDLDENHPLVKSELFCPILYIRPVKNLEEALTLANDTEYGLTAGFFSEDQEEIDLFFNTIRAGVTYVNRRSGATTGAWPGVQPFCGWQSSGSTGKGCCGPYYVTQFMREQSRTVMT